MTQISNFPINLRAEHYWVHVHVARSLAFLHVEHKDENFAKEFDCLLQSGTVLFPLLHNSSHLQVCPSDSDQPARQVNEQ